MLKQEIQRDLERVESEIGSGTAETFTWKTVDVPCIASSLGRGLDIELGGNAYTVTLSLIVRCNEFLTADTTLITVDSELYTTDSDLPTPIAGRTLVFRGKTYRIVTARESGPRSHYELALADYGSNR